MSTQASTEPAVLAGGTRLRASPNFSLASTYAGRPYVAKDSEPYVQYWLSERDRVLHGLFGGQRGATVAAAVTGYLRLTGAADTAAERRRLMRAIADMHGAEVLVEPRADASRYDARIAAAYLEHRPFPARLARQVIRSGGIEADTRVLDLAGGPGDLAVQLARVSRRVTLMELSKGFVAAARRHAARAGVPLRTLHESCNRLVHSDEQVDVVTISQALHWLDDMLVCRGLNRVLAPGGSFFVIHAALDLADRHPLAYLFGAQSILGPKTPLPFAAEAAALERRLALLFEALGAPGQRIAPVRTTLARERRPIGLGFARAFLTPRHIAVTGQEPTAFWRDLEARCAAARPRDLLAHQDWAVLHFRRARGG